MKSIVVRFDLKIDLIKILGLTYHRINSIKKFDQINQLIKTSIVNHRNDNDFHKLSSAIFMFYYIY